MTSAHSQKGSNRKKPETNNSRIGSTHDVVTVTKPPIPRVPQPVGSKGKSNTTKNSLLEPKCSEFLYERYGGERGPDSHLIEMLEREAHVKDLNIGMEEIADL